MQKNHMCGRVYKQDCLYMLNAIMNTIDTIIYKVHIFSIQVCLFCI